MTRIRLRTPALFALGILAVGPASSRLFGQPVPQEGAGTPPQVYGIDGTLVDATPDFSEALFARFERAIAQIPDAIQRSEQEGHELWEGALRDAFGRSRSQRVMPGVVVTLRGESLTGEVTTDEQGRYHFAGLPRGTYQISATAPVRPPSRNGPERTTTARREFTIYGSNQMVNLELHGESITLTGRVTDARGRPIAGAKLRGEPYPLPETSELTPPTRFAVSAADGSYEMSGFVPFHVMDIVKYLAGHSMIPDGHYFLNYSFYADVFAEADDFVQHRKNVPRVPIISEDMLDGTRRFGKILNQLVTIANEMEPKRDIEPWQEKQDLSPPASCGNTITGIDIVLEQAPPSASASGSVRDTNGNPAPHRLLELRMVDCDASPLADYVVDHWVEADTTDEDGAFEIQSIAPGRYSVIVYGPPPGRYNGYQVPVKGSVLELKPGQRVESFEIRVNPPADYAISGHVRDANGDSVCGLYVSTSISTGFSWGTSTDEEGIYRIECLDGTGLSSFRVGFGYGGLAIRDVPLNAENVDLIVPDRGSIHGVVRNATTGEVITTCQVSVPVVDLPESGAAWENPDVQVEWKPDGGFILSNVPAGAATVEIRADGLGTQRFVATVEAGKTSTLECEMAAPPSSQPKQP